MTVAVVVGYGSIGQRHARLLRELGCEVAVVSRRKVDHEPCFASISEVLSARKADYIVIASETSQHASAIEELRARRFSGRVLIEKPLGEMPAGFKGDTFSAAAVGYNLRFHPVLAALRDAIASERIIAIQVYCGQYLPDWRPGTDYRKAYSADPARGGGVLRDLSHELDYLLWLGGAWRRVSAIGGRLSALEIHSDDCWTVIAELENCPAASVQINYLDRPGRRQLIVNTASHTYAADLVRATFERDGNVQEFKVERDDTYRAQHRAMLAGDTSRLCSLADGARVMQFIAAVERSGRERVWVSA
jgi:predicted dehydrogenase